MDRKLQFVFLLLVAIFAISESSCPALEAIYPCKCDTAPRKTFECGASSQPILERAFNALRNQPADNEPWTILLKNYSLQFIPNILFNGIRVRDLTIETGELRSFNQSLVSVQNTLTTLTLKYQSNQQSDFDWGSLSPLKMLYNLFISGSFTAIRKPFPNLPAVTNFFFEDSDVSYIVDKAFAGLTAIYQMRLRHNKMQSYSRNMFAVPCNITQFFTRGIEIKTLPEDYFQDMPLLRYVEIPAFCHNIPPLMSKETVYLHGSRGVTCDSRLKWLLRMRDAGTVTIGHAICARPEHLYWRDVINLTYNDL